MLTSTVLWIGVPFDPKVFCNELQNLVGLDGLTTLDPT